jgi:sucrose phosphorylase
MTTLSNNTLSHIDTLLMQNEYNGEMRGLYSPDELQIIHSCLINLSTWLKENKPDFLAKTSSDYSNHHRFNEKTALCISYVDHIRSNTNDKPAVRLQKFYNTHLSNLYSHLHILPHFKSPIIHDNVKGPAARADGGFEAKDFKMDPYFGNPEDLTAVDGELMFDFVVNHLSVHGEWFQKFLEDEEGYEDFFVTISEDKIPNLDWTKIFRPREHNPVIPYTNSKGETKHVWCTFSDTQADININNPKVFCSLMEALVKDFIGQGASWIRLDAIGYLVKMFGLSSTYASTSCFGIDETHNILKAMRAFLSDIAPSLTLVPEVNATKDVIKTYYGENHDEGHLVYEFPSAPLSLFSIYQSDASAIMEWAKERTQDPECIGLAFTNSHDGIGVLPMADVENIAVGKPALDELLHQIERRGGGINYKTKIIDGRQKRIPYEACITWLQAILTPPEHAALMGNRLSEDDLETIVSRFIASHSFVYTAPHCVPSDYMGAITGLLNEDDLYYIAGHRRNKNRGLVHAEEFVEALQSPKTNYDYLRGKIFAEKKNMIETRQRYTAFSPYAKCHIDVVTMKDVSKKKHVYSILRHCPHGDEKVLAVTNCSNKKRTVHFKHPNLIAVNSLLNNSVQYDIIDDVLNITLAPYQVAWFKI